MSHLDAMDGLVFETDRNGIIRAIGENSWNSFAAQNGAPELSAEAVIGRNLFAFIQGEQVQDQIRRILERISHDPNWSWVLPFRCDAPDRRRNICQSLRPVFKGNDCTGFLFHSFYQYSWQRPPIGLCDFKRLQRLSKENNDLPSVMMCSWCQRVQSSEIAGGDWLSPEDYYAGGGCSDVRLSHGICDACLETTLDPHPV
jgi:hypothetical protein